MTDTVRLTAAQGLVRFRARQHRERDGVEQRLVTGMLGIFGHGNVAGVVQGLLQAGEDEAAGDPVESMGVLRYHLIRNEKGRPVPEPAALARAVEIIRSSRRPLIVAGGGVVYSEASEHLRALASATGIPVADTHAGKGAINWDHPSAVGGVGSTGSAAANALAAEADVVIGIGTRYSDFTTASHTAFADPDVRFVNVNVLRFDAAKRGAAMLVADAREAPTALTQALGGWQVDAAYRQRVIDLDADWQRVVDECYHRDHVAAGPDRGVRRAERADGSRGRRARRRGFDAR